MNYTALMQWGVHDELQCTTRTQPEAGPQAERPYFLLVQHFGLNHLEYT